MQELKGDLWSYFRQPGYIVCITTNGSVKKDGTLTMGKGCAREAADRIRNLPAYLGQLVQESGNSVYCINDRGGNPVAFSLPTKHQWWEFSDPQLIAKSLCALHHLCNKLGYLEDGTVVVLPRVGCGYGGLQWKDIKPIIEQYLPERNFIVVDHAL